MGQYRTWYMAAEPFSERGGAPGVGQDFYQFRWIPIAAHEYGVRDFYNRSNRHLIGKYSMQHIREDKTSTIERRAARQNRDTYEGGMGASGTPFFYALFGWFRTPSYHHDLKVFRLVCLSVSELTLLVLCLALSYSLAGTLAVFALCSYWFRPFGGLMQVANVNHLQLGLVGAAVLCARYLGRRSGPAVLGAILGFGLMFKPNPIFGVALLYLVFLARRDVRGFLLASLTGLMASAVAFASSSAYFGGVEVWVRWANRTSRALTSFSDWNKAPVAWIQQWTGFYAQPYLLGGMILAAAWLILRRGGMVRASTTAPGALANRTVLPMALGLVIPLVGFRVVWDHHYTLAIPMLLYLFRPASEGKGWQWRQIGAVLAAALMAGIPQLAGWSIGAATDMVLQACSGSILVGWGLSELARGPEGTALPCGATAASYPAQFGETPRVEPDL